MSLQIPCHAQCLVAPTSVDQWDQIPSANPYVDASKFENPFSPTYTSSNEEDNVELNGITALSTKCGDRHPPERQAKPPYSYIALISMSILSSPEEKMLLGDIYQFITNKFPYYNKTHTRAWKNSIRHNLSLNECFIKNGRADNGKGNYWSIHPACLEDFKRGDFRRRQARRRAKSCLVPQESKKERDFPLQYRCNFEYVPMASIPTNLASHISPGYADLKTSMTDTGYCKSYFSYATTVPQVSVPWTASAAAFAMTSPKAWVRPAFNEYAT